MPENTSKDSSGIEKQQRTGQGAAQGGTNEPERDVKEGLSEDSNRPEDSTTQNERKINPGTGFTTDPIINPDQGATKQW